jgi:hypothetical protein
VRSCIKPLGAACHDRWPVWRCADQAQNQRRELLSSVAFCAFPGPDLTDHLPLRSSTSSHAPTFPWPLNLIVDQRVAAALLTRLRVVALESRTPRFDSLAGASDPHGHADIFACLSKPAGFPPQIAAPESPLSRALRESAASASDGRSRPLAETGLDRFNVAYRRTPDIADRRRGRRMWAESGPTGSHSEGPEARRTPPSVRSGSRRSNGDPALQPLITSPKGSQISPLNRASCICRIRK